MQVGEVRVAEDTDYAFFKAMCKNHEDWSSVYAKNNVFVWTKQNDVSDFKMIKVLYNKIFNDHNDDLSRHVALETIENCS